MFRHSAFLRTCIRSIEIAGAVLALGASIVLGLRSALRLELRWDTFSYHLPMAALRAGLHIPFEMAPLEHGYYQGFPPLPEFLQGVLWRITGSMNATGVLNYLALCFFLFFVWCSLGARLWLTTMLCLTVPLVLIHAASSYVDLFTNALLAIGVTAFVGMALFERWMEKDLLAWALAGATAAAWSKLTTMPFVLLIFLGFFAVYGRRLRQPEYRRRFACVCAALLISLSPYVKNAVVYHNPIWPIGVSVMGHRFPSLVQSDTMNESDTPPPLMGASQPTLFFHSLFEIGHPTSYPNRARWIIDQGSTSGADNIAFRSGGFWVVSVITMTFSAILFGFLSGRRQGLIVTATIALLWGILSAIPLSHELRYYQFLPLAVAALIGILYPRAAALYPATSLVILCLIMGEFAYVTKVNGSYYRVERVGYVQAAEAYGVKQFWTQMEPGKTYCAVGFKPAAFLLTGPTMHEFHIIDREDASQCPPNVDVLRR